MRTEGKVAELLSAFDLLALFDSRDDRADHHRADTHRDGAPEGRAVDRYDLARVLAINVKRRPYRLRLW